MRVLPIIGAALLFAGGIELHFGWGGWFLLIGYLLWTAQDDQRRLGSG